MIKRHLFPAFAEQPEAKITTSTVWFEKPVFAFFAAKLLPMALYIFIGVVITGFIILGIWAARHQKKRLKLTEEFFESTPVKALLDSGFQKDPNGIYGRLNNYDVGLYVWFDPGNTRYFTYLNCNIPGGISYRMDFSQKHRLAERIDIEMNSIQQELKQIDGDTLARSFARLQEIATLEKFEPLPPRPPGITITH